ncbi:hypothetical protein E4U33_005107 [Claviceps sp. LM78 group G4]|nr:hypothetical protein E4U33_005107 [Claviceps sp. LM78 group G4]
MRPDAAVMVDRGGHSSADTRPYPPAMYVSPLTPGNNGSPANAASAATPDHRCDEFDCRYRNLQSAPTAPGARRTNVNNLAAASGNA